MFLGVQNYTTNEALNGEMGWRSLETKQKLFWNRMCHQSSMYNLSENRPYKQIFNRDWITCNKNWRESAENILEEVTGDDIHFIDQSTVNIEICGDLLDEIDINKWQEGLEGVSNDFFRLKTSKITTKLQ